VLKQNEAEERLAAQLIEATAQIAKSRDRQKEMARVIASRDIKIAEREAEIARLRTELAQSQAELHTRYEELATLERRLLRSSQPESAKSMIRYIAASIPKPFGSYRRGS
jgi:chromosome segregation ATPase